MLKSDASCVFTVRNKNILTQTKSIEHMNLRSGSLGVQKQPK
jgi:hypothetical protein